MSSQRFSATNCASLSICCPMMNLFLEVVSRSCLSHRLTQLNADRPRPNWPRNHTEKTDRTEDPKRLYRQLLASLLVVSVCFPCVSVAEMILNFRFELSVYICGICGLFS